MREVRVKTWTREAQVPVGLLESLRELNHRFLDLIAGQCAQWRSIDGELKRQVTPLSPQIALTRCSICAFTTRRTGRCDCNSSANGWLPTIRR